MILLLDAIGCARARRILAFRRTWDWLRNATSQVWEMVVKKILSLRFFLLILFDDIEFIFVSSC